MKVKKIISIMVLTVICFCAFTQNNNQYDSLISLRGTSGADIPLGNTSTYFEPGILSGLSVLLTPEAVSPFVFSGNFEFVRNKRDEEQYLSKFGFTGGGGIQLGLLSRLSVYAGVEGGYSFCMMDTDGGTEYAGIPVFTVTAGPSFELFPGLSLNLLTSFQGFPGLTYSLGQTAGVTYRFKKRQAFSETPVLEGLPPKIIDLQFAEIFPVFYSYYDDHPVGSAIILNPREDEITDITLDFFVNQYMDTPKRCRLPDTLMPGETGNVDIIALFNNSVLGITEGTKVAAELTLSYKVDGVKYTDVHSATMRMQYRNAMTWDDDRRAAAFVTAKDPAIMGFAKNVASMLHESDTGSINKKFQQAMAIHNALTHYGLTYVIDPTTSYAELSTQKTSIDFLQFPRETLEYKAGDCDDLSILHCALFEAIGIETAFVTVPGHIFIAFALGITPDEAARTFSDRNNLIIENNKVWIPFEITALKESFLEAWDLGARQWREHSSAGRAGFYPIRDAWQYYEPVGLPGTGGNILMPPADEVVETFYTEISTFINREMAPRIERYKAEIERTQGRPKSHNKLGVLYARYGFTSEALEQFEHALERGEYYPALMNIGNIEFLGDRFENALDYYNRAYSLAPDNPKVNLCIARTSYSLGDKASTETYYEKLKNIDPALAERFSYLDPDRESEERASNINESEGIVVWMEEE